MLNQFGVIGNPVAHSLSPEIHERFAAQTGVDLSYVKIKGDQVFFEQQVADFFAQQGVGLNVTLPFKQRAYAVAQNTRERCHRAGAANTLWMENNQLHADNTDGVGLVRDLRRHITTDNLRILILGAGGATRGIIAPLLSLNPKILTVANRTKDKVQQLQYEFPEITGSSLNDISGNFNVVINATSMSLNEEVILLSDELMALQPFCYDLAYSIKSITPFVRYAQSKACPAVDGLGMLVEQAAESFYIWHGIMPATGSVLAHWRSIT